jgi:hypothetical protein
MLTPEEIIITVFSVVGGVVLLLVAGFCIKYPNVVAIYFGIRTKTSKAQGRRNKAKAIGSEEVVITRNPILLVDRKQQEWKEDTDGAMKLKLMKKQFHVGAVLAKPPPDKFIIRIKDAPALEAQVQEPTKSLQGSVEKLPDSSQ